jgi:hypothetical protein
MHQHRWLLLLLKRKLVGIAATPQESSWMTTLESQRCRTKRSARSSKAARPGESLGEKRARMLRVFSAPVLSLLAEIDWPISYEFLLGVLE